jgi:hypothetical protein
MEDLDTLAQVRPSWGVSGIHGPQSVYILKKTLNGHKYGYQMKSILDLKQLNHLFTTRKQFNNG